MSRQILLCVETNSKARTDYQYINETIHRFYVNDPKISYKPIFLESKSMNTANIRNRLKELGYYCNPYLGWHNLFTCVFGINSVYSLDDYDTNYETKKLFEDIKKYCETHAYELVFFCRDVEEVYLGKRVNDKDKVNEVKRFKSKKMIEAVLPQNLSQNEYKINGSNILNILDKFWTRKN